MRVSIVRLVAALAAVSLVACQTASTQQHGSEAAVAVGENDLGVVTSADGPEAGVMKFQLRPDPLAR